MWLIPGVFLCGGLFSMLTDGPSGLTRGRVFGGHGTLGYTGSIRLNLEFGYVYGVLENNSDSPLTIVDVRPVWRGPDDVVVVQKVLPADLVVGDRSFQMGSYQTDPPVMRIHRDCVSLNLRQPVSIEPLVLEPGDPELTMYVLFRAQRIGSTKLADIRVIYEQGGSFYEETIGLELDATVAKDGRTMRPMGKELRCYEQEGVRLLTAL